MTNDYIPYGEEWVKEMKKLPKDFLIDMLKKSLMGQDAAREDEAGKMLDFAEYFRNNFEYYDCNANGNIYKNVSSRSGSAITMKEILSKWKHKNEKL